MSTFTESRSSEQHAFTDPSCYHATLATLLLEHNSAIDPAVVLGSTATTEARRRQDGWVVLDDTLPALCATLDARGYHVVQRLLADARDAEELSATLREGQSALAIVDTFYLNHYWVDCGRVHAPHAVVLREFDAADGTVRLTDPVDIVYFDGRIPLADLAPALAGDSVERSWLTLRAKRSAEDRRADQLWASEIAEQVEQLTGLGRPRLSGVELTDRMAESVDDILNLVPAVRRPEEVIGQDSERDQVAELLTGMWTYHHTLRWYGRYLGHVPVSPGSARTPLATATDAVEQASQDWLVARGLLIRSAVLSAKHRHKYRGEVLRRLQGVRAAITTAAGALRETVGGFP